MSDLKTSHMPERLHAYMLEVGVREPDILARLRAETEPLPLSIMQISPDQGAFMAMLVKLLDMRRILEIGVFTGYSSLAMALALPDDGRITALDVSEEWTAIARRYWREAGVADKIDLQLAPALDSLDSLLEQGEAETYDFAFIDADKENYPHYYERSLQLVRPGGLIAIDNAFHLGRVVDPARGNAETPVIDRLNRAIRDDDRVDIAMTPIGDGIMFCRRRG
ncbi:MAG: class I SAM-dependent methyltransferase [Minwuiales bacterium]|nr:class I SAM-dependent methyltransferase [Minwuiales bacterium]